MYKPWAVALIVFLTIACSIYYLHHISSLDMHVPYYYYEVPMHHFSYHIKSTNLSLRMKQPNQKSKYSICAYCVGRLGNHLFILASTYGIAASKNMSFAIHRSCSVAKFFKIGEHFKSIGSDCDSFRRKHESQACAYSNNIMDIKPNVSHRLSTFLQSWKYFQESVDVLKQELQFENDIQQRTQAIVSKLLEKYQIIGESVTLIGVHVRRGDIVNNKYGYRVATKEYLLRAVNYYLSKQFSKPVFIVCSNDINWSKQNMPNNISVEFVSGFTPEVDLSILAACDHIISTVGTFSWFAGFLSGGLVTYFQWPAEEGSNLRKQFSKNYSDFFMPDWIGFE